MSVYQSQRSEASVLYLQSARELRKMTYQIIKKFPKSYRWLFTNNVADLATKVFTHCSKANGITYTLVDDEAKNYRKKQLYKAKANITALLNEISFGLELFQQGENTFKTREQFYKTFERWVEKGNETQRLINKIIESNK